MRFDSWGAKPSFLGAPHAQVAVSHLVCCIRHASTWMWRATHQYFLYKRAPYRCNAGVERVSVRFFSALIFCFDLFRVRMCFCFYINLPVSKSYLTHYVWIFSKLPTSQKCYPWWIDSSYVPLSKPDEKLRAEKNNTGDPPAAGLLCPIRAYTLCSMVDVSQQAIVVLQYRF